MWLMEPKLLITKRCSSGQRSRTLSFPEKCLPCFVVERASSVVSAKLIGTDHFLLSAIAAVVSDALQKCRLWPSPWILKVLLEEVSLRIHNSCSSFSLVNPEKSLSAAQVNERPHFTPWTQRDFHHFKSIFCKHEGHSRELFCKESERIFYSSRFSSGCLRIIEVYKEMWDDW